MKRHGEGADGWFVCDRWYVNITADRQLQAIDISKQLVQRSQCDYLSRITLTKVYSTTYLVAFIYVHTDSRYDWNDVDLSGLDNARSAALIIEDGNMTASKILDVQFLTYQS
jgi:hypothetical protein